MDHVEALHQQLKQNPDDSDTWSVLADAYYERGEENRSSACRFISEHPDLPRAYRIFGPKILSR